MREIKFRGLRTDGKGWVYGDLITAPDGMAIQCGEDKYFEMHEIIPESVGQYTGLKDKNGIEIYEGDIVTNGKLIYKIEYSVQNSHFRKTPIDSIEGDFDILLDTIDWGQLGNGYYSRKDLTITGNIHVNN